jgi:hypothetical protein
MSTIVIDGTEYSRAYRVIERALHPDVPPVTPDPAVAQTTRAVLRALGASAQVSECEVTLGEEAI